MDFSADDMMKRLIDCGKISIDDVRDVEMLRIEEVLMRYSVKTPKITERQKGDIIQYYCVVPERYSKTGRRHQIVCSSYEECKKKFKREAYDVINRSNDIENKKLQDLVLEYLESTKYGIKKTSYERLRRFYENHIKNSQFGLIKISDVRLPECQAYINSKYKDLGYVSIKQLKSLISMSLEFGVAHDYILRNYMKAVKINKNLCSIERLHQTGVWTDDEISKIGRGSLEMWKKHKKFRYSAVTMLMIYTGLRAGEILAVTWDDIDMDKRTITVDKTSVRYTDYDTGKKVSEISTTKTADSRRTVYLVDEAIFWIREIRKRNFESGISIACNARVVATQTGGIVKSDVLNAQMKKLCAEIGIEYKSSHTCRRTYATVLIDGGVPISDVSADLGHKNVSTTQQCYYKQRESEDIVMQKKNSAFLATVGNR